MKQLLLVAVGGALGSVGRFVLSSALFRMAGDAFPLGTLSVNVIGCGLIGAVFQWEAEARWLPSEWRIALVAGFLGGLTTFSTFGLETVRLFELGRSGVACANVLTNVLAGLAAVVGGMATIRWLGQ